MSDILAQHDAIRGALFSGTLAMAGLTLTALGFLTTRIHDFMKTEQAKATRAEVAQLSQEYKREFNPVHSLEVQVRRGRLAITLAFVASLTQLLPIFVPTNWMATAAFVVAGASIITACVVAWEWTQVYSAWLAVFRRELLDEARVTNAKKRATG